MTHHGFIPSVFADLAAFTGLPEAVCRERAYRSGSLHAHAWRFWDPKTRAEAEWFSRTTTAYIFTLCRREPFAILSTVDLHDLTVLDIGAGIGTDCLYAAQRGAMAWHLDANHWNTEFARFRHEKHLDEMGGTMHFGVYPMHFDVVIARDVIEHIPDYPEWLRGVVLPQVAMGGHLVWSAPFCRSHVDDNVGLHVNQTEPVSEILKGAGFEQRHAVPMPPHEGDTQHDYVRAR